MKQILKLAVAALCVSSVMTFAWLVPELDYTTKVTDTLRSRSIKHVQATRLKINWRFTNSDSTAFDLTGATQVTFIYEPDSLAWSVPITGAVDNATNGQVSFVFTPANCNTNGDFYFTLTVEDGSGPMCRALGELQLQRLAGAGITNAFPPGTTNINWLNYVYSNTSSNGPYRAGTGIVFTANADGSVDVNADPTMDDVFTNYVDSAGASLRLQVQLVAGQIHGT